MGKSFSSLSRSDLESATAFDVGSYVGRIGPDYEIYLTLIVKNAFNGAYIIFKYNSNAGELFSLLHITEPAHIDFLKYQFTTIYAKETICSMFCTPGGAKSSILKVPNTDNSSSISTISGSSTSSSRSSLDMKSSKSLKNNGHSKKKTIVAPVPSVPFKP